MTDTRLVVDEERGIIQAYNADGDLVVEINAETISHLLTGTVKNAFEGLRIELSSLLTNVIRGYLADESVGGNLSLSSAGAYIQYGDPIAGTGDAVGAASDGVHIRGTEIILDTNRQARGYCSVHQAGAQVAAGDKFGNGVPYGGVSKLTNVPSSITFTGAGTDSNVASVAAETITNRGFTFTATATSGGTFLRADRTFVTVGN